MKAIWKWLGTPAAAKLIALAFCMYFAAAVLGDTGSYWQAFHSIVIFYAIWGLGRMSVKDQT